MFYKQTVLHILAVIFIATCAYSHSGGTDAKGGHYNRKTGEYHFHNTAKLRLLWQAWDLVKGKLRLMDIF